MLMKTVEAYALAPAVAQTSAERVLSDPLGRRVAHRVVAAVRVADRRDNGYSLCRAHGAEP